MSRILLLPTLLLFSIALLTASPLWPQGPSADWKTLESEHFRWHYPAPARPWVEGLAPRLEAIRQRVSEEVGYAPSETVDVLVMDPVSRANGSAWPMLGWPRMVLWTTPPGPDSVIGHYDDWSTLLAIHEEVHLAHLLRPSRHPMRRRLGRLIPIGPVARKSPRWVSEGYATLLEGQLTGFGRPHSDLRATILRRWAQQGELPSYGQMSSDGERWFGMSMAYLMGSAYLEWLQRREGPEALRHLWTRLAAHRQRTFDEAFRGVFGDSPRKLYNRFCAELTFRALSLEQELAPREQQGELWQDLAWTSGAPVVSPDGRLLAMVLRSKDGPSRLVAWSTEPNDEAEAAWAEQGAELLVKDPDDILAVRRGPLPRQPAHRLVTRHGAAPYTPRWLPGGHRLLFVRFEPDRNGFLSPDLFQWSLKEGSVQRLTTGERVRDPDPSPDGTWAVAVRHQYGRSQLVRVELPGGDVRPMDNGGANEVIAFPRISPDGGSLAYVRQAPMGHEPSGWQLVVRPLQDDRAGLGPAKVVATPEGARITHPEWHREGQHLYVSLGLDGFIDIYQLALTGSDAVPLTHSQGAALAPAPTADGEGLFYLAMEPDGLDLRRMNLDDLPAPEPLRSPVAHLSTARRKDLEPILPPLEASTPRLFESALRPPAQTPTTTTATPEAGDSTATTASSLRLSAERPYGWGRPELLPLLGGRSTVDQDVFEVGLRLGDLLGRFELLAMTAISGNGTEGAALHWTWRGQPVVWRGSLFNLSSAADRPTDAAVDAFDDLRGFEVAAGRAWQRRTLAWQIEAGLQLAEVRPAATSTFDGRRLGFLDLGLTGRQRWGNWRLVERWQARAEAGRTAGDDWQRFTGGLRLDASRSSLGRLAASWRQGESSATPPPFEHFRLGGLRGSLLSPLALSQEVSVAALPRLTATGETFETFRVELQPGAGPWTLFYERHRLTAVDTVEMALRGLEVRWQGGPLPLLRLPALTLHAGVAEILDAPFDGDIEGWLALTWAP